MRNVLRALACCVLALAATSGANAAVIYQAFDQRFVDVEAQLGELKDLGYDIVQVSPAQKSLDLPDWWARYQPVDYLTLSNRLGTGEELRHLTTAAHSRGMKVLVDVVLNHMADPVMSGHPNLDYPQFSPQDFHRPYSRDCISDWGSRTQVTQYWLCDLSRGHHLADLDTSSQYVRSVHKQHLQKLLALGVDGFRFDAMKHIEPSYFAAIMPSLPTDKFYYGEVIGESVAESQQYTRFMPVTDFHLLRVMLSSFSINGDLRNLTHPESVGGALPGNDAVVFSRNHDTAMAPQFFNFGDYRDAMLANAFVISRGVGTPLVYRDDYKDPLVLGALRFNKRLQGKSSYVRRVADVCESEQACNPRTTLFLERGRFGLVIINTSDTWLDIDAARMPGLEAGCYRELSNNFSVTVSQGSDGHNWISAWGSPDRGGMRVGPRTALFLAKSGQDDCSLAAF